MKISNRNYKKNVMLKEQKWWEHVAWIEENVVQKNMKYGP
jgi:hypothetical protein